MQVDNKLAIPTYSPPSPTIAKSKYFIYIKKKFLRNIGSVQSVPC